MRGVWISYCLDLLRKNYAQRCKWQQNQNILRLENKTENNGKHLCWKSRLPYFV